MHASRVWIVDGRDFVGAAAGPTPVIPPALAQRLSHGERARLQRFLKPQRAREFLLGRLLLRHALCQVLDCREDDIAVIERPGAAPAITVAGQAADGITLPGLSLSHSRGWLACAMGDTFPLGVDIEVPAPQRDLPALAGVMFSAAEVHWLGQRSQSDSHNYDDAFYRLWCAKEAIYKHRHNAGLADGDDDGGLPQLDCHAQHAMPRSSAGFLRHECSPDFHLSLFSAVRPERHASAQMDCAELLKSTRS